jgi:hypothetical protein
MWHSGKLILFQGEPLTVHGELNKLIANVTNFRDGAGMHWRSDGAANERAATIEEWRCRLAATSPERRWR